jgi:DNA-binding beta-propeller fold protein YncE
MPGRATSPLALAVAAVAAAACISSCAASHPAPPPSPGTQRPSQPARPASHHPGLLLQQVADVPLPDGTSRFDYESIDPLRRALYIAHLGASTIAAVNLTTRHVQADLHGIAEVHGVLAVPSLGRLFASATGSGQAVMISEKTGRILTRAPAGAYPDGIAYDPAKQVAAESGVVTVFAEQRRSLVTLGRKFLATEAHTVAVDPVTHLVYFALQDVGGKPVLRIMDPIQ